MHQLIRKETVNSRSTMQNHHLNSGFKGGKMPICSGCLVRQERIAKLETEVQSLKQKLGEAAVSGKLPWCQKNLTWIMEPENGKFQEEHAAKKCCGGRSYLSRCGCDRSIVEQLLIHAETLSNHLNLSP